MWMYPQKTFLKNQANRYSSRMILKREDRMNPGILLTSLRLKGCNPGNVLWHSWPKSKLWKFSILPKCAATVFRLHEKCQAHWFRIGFSSTNMAHIPIHVKNFQQNFVAPLYFLGMQITLYHLQGNRIWKKIWPKNYNLQLNSPYKK